MLPYFSLKLWIGNLYEMIYMIYFGITLHLIKLKLVRRLVETLLTVNKDFAKINPGQSQSRLPLLKHITRTNSMVIYTLILPSSVPVG